MDNVAIALGTVVVVLALICCGVVVAAATKLLKSHSSYDEREFCLLSAAYKAIRQRNAIDGECITNLKVLGPEGTLTITTWSEKDKVNRDYMVVVERDAHDGRYLKVIPVDGDVK